MWKMWNSLLGVVLLSAVSWGFIVQHPPDLLFYFESVKLVVSSKGSSADETTINYNNTNTKVEYATTVMPDKKQIDIELNFKRNDSVAQDVISSLTLMLTLLETPRQYYKLLNNVSATVKGPKLPTDTIRLLTAIPLEAPKDRSFHCSRFGRLYPDFDANVKMINNTFNLEFKGLQLQAFNGTNTPSDQFGEPYDCVGYFTAGIWSGIFIAAILIGIITWGLAMIMDVKTMDRFDDPKGKPISFGGTE